MFLRIKSSIKSRGGLGLLDRFAVKLSYNRLIDIMPLLLQYQGHAPHKFEPYYKPHQEFGRNPG